MKAVILAGGLGTRLAEETSIRPKPMVEIGGSPIIWHIMNTFAASGLKEFCVACGYKGEVIKEYFDNYHLHHADLTVDMRNHAVKKYNNHAPDWLVHLIDTGKHTLTGGRIKRLKPWIENDTFMMTYGDGVADVNINKIIDFHKSHNKLVTITAVRPPSRFGELKLSGDNVTNFLEKPQIGEGWINGGYMVLEPQVLNYIKGDETIFEQTPLEKLTTEGQVMAYKHDGFWHPMDTIRDKQFLEELWTSGQAPWRI